MSLRVAAATSKLLAVSAACGSESVSSHVTSGDGMRTGDAGIGDTYTSGDPRTGSTEVVGECIRSTDCTTPGTCGSAAGVTCVNHLRMYPPLPAATPCTDTNLCASNEHCDGAGRCVGETRDCTSPPSQEYLPGDGASCRILRHGSSPATLAQKPPGRSCSQPATLALSTLLPETREPGHTTRGREWASILPVGTPVEGRKLDDVVRSFPYAHDVRKMIRAGVDAVASGFAKDWRKSDVVGNIVLYWGDDACDLAYVNNSQLAGSSGDIEAIIQARPFGAWLDGERLERRFFGLADLDFEALRKQFGKKEDLALTKILMLRICEALELSRPFTESVCVADDLLVLSVNHDDEDVVELRDRHVLAPARAGDSTTEEPGEFLRCDNCGAHNDLSHRKCLECAKPLRDELRRHQKAARRRSQ